VPEPANLSGAWRFEADCRGVGLGIVFGEILTEQVGPSTFEGIITNSFGYTGSIETEVQGAQTTSLMFWSDGQVTTSTGALAPGGATWRGRDSYGCDTLATRQ
jgi:hypothetical protein